MAPVELFRALGDPIRLEIIQRLATGDPFTISSLTYGLGVSRQGARKHLQLLAEADVVSLVPQGRDTTVQLKRQALKQGEAYLARLERQWEARLEALREFVDED